MALQEESPRRPRVRIKTSDIVYNIREDYPLPIRQAGLEKALQLFAEHHGLLRTSDAIRVGIHPRTLYALRDSGELEQVSRGFYRLSKGPALTNPDLVAVALRIPRAVICLISAFAYHGLTTEIPHSVDVALPGHAQIPKLGGIPLRAFWYSEPSFSAGVQTVSIDGVAVRIYSPEKSIADGFKYRNKIGLDLAIQALRTYRDRSKRQDLQLISKFAALDRVERVMRPYLEAVL